MRELFPCNRCQRTLPAEAFGELTDNMETVTVQDRTCRECRAIEGALSDLIAEARIAVGRAGARLAIPAWAMAEAKSAVEGVLAAYHEAPEPFVTELLAKFALLHVEGDDLPVEVAAFYASRLPKPIS